MTKIPPLQVSRLRASELEEAGRIGAWPSARFRPPNPLEFLGDRDFVAPRWRASNTAALAAREAGKLIGSTMATRWGSFAFFGPLTILPDYWNRGVAQQLLTATMKVFDRWGVKPHRPVHLRAQSQTRGPVPEVWLLARISHGDHETRAGSAFAGLRRMTPKSRCCCRRLPGPGGSRRSRHVRNSRTNWSEGST